LDSPSPFLILMALALSIAVVAFGYWEMLGAGSRANGASTWGFAVPPFGGSLLGVWYSEGLPFLARVGIILALVASASVGLSWLYRRAHTDAFRHEGDAREP
jgi:hypothetical protein